MNLQNARTLEASVSQKNHKERKKITKPKNSFIDLTNNERQYITHLFNPIYLQPCTCTHLTLNYSELWNSCHQRDLCRLSSLLQLSHQHSVAQGSVQMDFQYLQGRRLHNFSAQPVMTCPDGKKRFLVFRRNLLDFDLWPFHKGA